MNHVARTNYIQQVLWVIGMSRVFHGIQMIEIAKKFVKAVYSGKELIEIPQVVLTKLTSLIALGFECSGNGAGLSGNSDFCACLSNCGHACSYGQFSHNEVCTAGSTARFRIVVRENHSFAGHLVEIGCSACHQTPVVSANIPHTDVIPHNDQDVGFFVLRISRKCLA